MVPLGFDCPIPHSGVTNHLHLGRPLTSNLIDKGLIRRNAE